MIKKPTKISSLLFAMFLLIGFVFPVAGVVAATKVDINSASVTQLEAVTGIGQDTAQNIVDYKKEHGKFKSMQELEAVSGVGKVRLQALNDAFTVKSAKKVK